MNNVTCTIDRGSIIIYRDGFIIGTVIDPDGEPTIVLFDRFKGDIRLTFGDLEIIMDNWNVMKELYSTKITL